MHEAFLAPEVDAKGPRGQRSIGGYHEDATNGHFVRRDGLGYREVSTAVQNKTAWGTDGGLGNALPRDTFTKRPESRVLEST